MQTALWVLCSVWAADALVRSFTEGSCNSLLPMDSATENDPDRLPNRSRLRSPFTIETNATEYKRGRPLEISVKGAQPDAFMIILREKIYGSPKPIGKFTHWPTTTKPLQCDGQENSAITNTKFPYKDNITLTWLAPEDDEGPLEVVGTFIKDNEYWISRSRSDLVFNEFPISTKNCGTEKACIRYSSENRNCEPGVCEYVATYKLTENNRTVEFVLGGLTKSNHSYVAIGFTNDKENLTDMDFVVCSRYDTAVDRSHYKVESKYGRFIWEATTMQPLKEELDGETLWCKFNRQLKANNELDLSKPMYQVYAWGALNETDEEPILSPETLFVSEELVNISELQNKSHLVSGCSTLVSTLLTLILTLLPIFLLML